MLYCQDIPDDLVGLMVLLSIIGLFPIAHIIAIILFPSPPENEE